MQEVSDLTMIRQMLVKILSSRTFEKSERGRDVLRYLVEEELAGRGKALKGFSIALDIFGKDASFDAAHDPLVRVQVGRLRELLVNYYETEGVNDPLQISIPLGRYRPDFMAPALTGSVSLANEKITEKVTDSVLLEDSLAGEVAKTQNSDPDESSDPHSSVKRHIQLIWTVVCFFAILLGLFFWHYSNGINEQEQLSGVDDNYWIAELNLPRIQLFGDVSDPEIKRTMNKVLDGLSVFDHVHAGSIFETSALNDKSNKWQALDYGLIVENSTKLGSGEKIIKVELVRLKDLTKIWFDNFPIDIWDKPEIRIVLARTLSGGGTPEGAVYADALANGSASQEMICLSKVRNYYDLRNERKLRDAFECIALMAEVKSVSGVMKAMWAGLWAEAIGRNYVFAQIPADKPEAVRQTLQIGLEAVTQSPLSARAAREIGFIYSWRGEYPLMVEWFKRANALNPFDTSISASYGYGMVLMGQYPEASQFLNEAITATVRHPTWWDFYYSISLVMQNRIEEATKAIIPLGLAKRNILYSILNTIVALESGDALKAGVLRRDLVTKYPEVVADPAGVFKNRNFPPDLVDRLLKDLEKAGE